MLHASTTITPTSASKNRRIFIRHAHHCMYCISCIIILLSPESDLNAITSSHRSCLPPVFHNKMGEFPQVLFPTAPQVNLLACYIHTVPLMLSVKQGSCEYQFESHWFDPTRNQLKSAPPEMDALTTRPFELLKRY